MRMMDRLGARESPRGQSLVEFALVFPLFALVLFSVITLGLYVFYQAEVTNAARQAVRYTAIHSSTAQCPTTSWLTPQAPPLSYYACDPPTSWPGMKTAARAAVWGLDPSAVTLAACWSGFRDPLDATSYDYPAIDASGNPNTYAQCTIAGTNPLTSQDAIPCPAPATTTSDDKASDNAGNSVTVYACYRWAPPMAGFVLIPATVTIRAVVTEVIQRQQ